MIFSVLINKNRKWIVPPMLESHVQESSIFEFRTNILSHHAVLDPKNYFISAIEFPSLPNKALYIPTHYSVNSNCTAPTKRAYLVVTTFLNRSQHPCQRFESLWYAPARKLVSLRDYTWPITFE